MKNASRPAYGEEEKAEAVQRVGFLSCCTAVGCVALLLLAGTAFAADSQAAYVKASLRDPRYFELTDGRPYVPIGFNLVRAPKENEFESVLDAMAANKVNYCRIWLNDLP